MGMNIQVVSRNWSISLENGPKALEAINRLHVEIGYEQASDLAEAFKMWDFEVAPHHDGMEIYWDLRNVENRENLYFGGPIAGYHRLNPHSAKLWRTVAPYVASGSFIKFFSDEFNAIHVCWFDEGELCDEDGILSMMERENIFEQMIERIKGGIWSIEKITE